VLHCAVLPQGVDQERLIKYIWPTNGLPDLTLRSGGGFNYCCELGKESLVVLPTDNIDFG